MMIGVLAIPLATVIPTPNARKTCALAIWLIQTQRLPAEVLTRLRDRIGYALRRAIEGELGKEGKKGSVSDGLKVRFFVPSCFVCRLQVLHRQFTTWPCMSPVSSCLFSLFSSTRSLLACWPRQVLSACKPVMPSVASLMLRLESPSPVSTLTCQTPCTNSFDHLPSLTPIRLPHHRAHLVKILRLSVHYERPLAPMTLALWPTDPSGH